MPNYWRGYVGQNRKGRWFARTTTTDNSGKRRNIVRKAKDKSEAEEPLKSMIRELDDEGSKVVDVARLTFNDLADHYEKHYLKPAVFVGDRKVDGLRDWKHVQAFLGSFREHFGRKRLREITYADICSFRSKLLQTPTQYKRQRSVTTVNRELSYVRRILNIAVRESWLVKNPFNCGDTLISAADERKRERILTVSEELRLFETCEHPQRRHLRPLLIRLLDAGARFSETTKLRGRSVCFVTRLVTIEGLTTKTLSPDKTCAVPRTNSCAQPLPMPLLPPVMTTTLSAYRKLDIMFSLDEVPVAGELNAYALTGVLPIK